MAFGVRITGLPATGDEALWSIEAPWWKTDELMADPRFRDVSEDAGYADYGAVMTLDEAKALAARYAPHGETFDHWKEPMEELDRRLANHDGHLDRVRITVSEWSSGL